MTRPMQIGLACMKKEDGFQMLTPIEATMILNGSIETSLG